MKTTFRQSFRWPSLDGFQVKGKQHFYLFEQEEQRVRELLTSTQITEQDGGDDHRLGMTIAITGERGNGKTSFLWRIKDQIREGNLSEDNLWVLPIVNPSYFSSHLNVLEILIASIQKSIEKQSENKESLDDGYSYEAMNRQIDKVGGIIARMRIDRSKSADTSSTRDYFNQSVNILNLADTLTKLIGNYLSVISMNSTKVYKRLVLMVDDVDLIDNEYISNIWADIQNVLSMTPLVVILSYRESQLRNALIQRAIKSNETLLESNRITLSELQSQVAAKIEKQVPDQRKVVLKSASEILGKQMIDLVRPFYVENGNINDTMRNLLVGGRMLNDPEINNVEYFSANNIAKFNVHQWLSWFFRLHVNMRWQPVNEFEQVDELNPISLREFVDLFQLITQIADLDMDSSQGESLYAGDNYRKILKSVKDYYLNRAKRYLPQNLNLILTEFDEAQVRSKNMTIYAFLFNLEMEMRSHKVERDTEGKQNPNGIYAAVSDKYGLSEEPLVQAPMTSRENISLGDVMHIISLLEMELSRSKEWGLFFATLKFLYSCEMQRGLFEGFKNGDFRAYCTLVNGLPMPQEYNYFSKDLNGYNLKSNQLSVSLASGSSEEIKNKIKSLRYSSVSINSRFTRFKISQSTSHVRNSLSQLSRYSKRAYFVTNNNENQVQFIPNSRYPIDFYAGYVKEEYLKGYLNEINEVPLFKLSFDKLKYVIEDVFDIDFFMGYSYTEKPGLSDALIDIVDKIKLAVCGANTEQITNGNSLVVREGRVSMTNAFPNNYFLSRDDVPELAKAIESDNLVTLTTIVEDFEETLIEKNTGSVNDLPAKIARQNLRPIVSQINRQNQSVDFDYSVVSDFVDENRVQYNATVKNQVYDLYNYLKGQRKSVAPETNLDED